MYWTLELASKLEDAPWPATKEELLDYATRTGLPLEVIENLQEIEDEGATRVQPGANCALAPGTIPCTPSRRVTQSSSSPKIDQAPLMKRLST